MHGTPVTEDLQGDHGVEVIAKEGVLGPLTMFAIAFFVLPQAKNY